MGQSTAGRVTDVTAEVAEALPQLVSGRGEVRVLLVDYGPPLAGANAPASGLAAGVLRRVRSHIDQHLAEPLPLRELARIAGLSDYHFARAFRRSTGLPPHRYLLMRRIEHARELIERSDRPIAAIALDLGFADQSHFTRCFAAATGLTPRAFRRQRR